MPAPYKTATEIPQDEFDDMIRELARRDGTSVVLDIPGVWECVSEFYNNAAIDELTESEDYEPTEQEEGFGDQ
jgi:hypothetical protein